MGGLQWGWIHPCPAQRMNIVDKAVASDAAVLAAQCLGEWTIDELLLLLDDMEACNLEWYFRRGPLWPGRGGRARLR